RLRLPARRASAAKMPKRPAPMPARARTAPHYDARMPTLYEKHLSGNCYKVRLACAQLGVPLTLVELDLASGATRTPEFLALNPIGRVPTLRLDDGTTLAES